MRFNELLFAPLSLVAVSAYLDSPLSVRINEFGVEKLAVGGLSIPTDEKGRMLINYHGGAKTFTHVSVTDILRGGITENMLKDKLVVVGATATGIYDMRVTPFDNVFPGLEIHANLMGGVLSKNFLKRPNWGVYFDIAAIVGTGLLLWLVLPGAGVVVGAGAFCFLFVGYILAGQYVFSHQGWILNLVYPLCVIVFLYVSITAYKYLVELRQKRFIRSAFSTYLAPSVVNQLVESPEKLVLGGENRVITAFFSDVQGFTGISERLTPGELVELLNEFLTEMTDVILANEGTVDKFEGDAIIAFFGAPNDLQNQENVACTACIQMQNRLIGLRSKWAVEGKPELFMRIGMCTGPAVVGNMGSKNRMDYTMMGDTVNTAARLEGVNKVYGAYTLIGETTYTGITDQRIVTRELDSINVVGKKAPITVYQVLGFSEQVDAPMRETMVHYARGLAAYRNRQWDEAMAVFENALSITPDDGPSNALLVRCREYKIDPPAEGWNGAFTMKTK